MSDLTDKEERAVRTALKFLRLRAGDWRSLADALKMPPNTIEKVVNGRRNVTARMALRIARFVDVSFDDLVGGRYLSVRTCPHCGHPPEDFVDEDTRVEEPVSTVNR